MSNQPLRWFKKHAICQGEGDALAGFEKRLLEQVYQGGFDSFKQFMAHYSYCADSGTAWTLAEIADDIGVPQAAFISYHARWVEATAPALEDAP